jgi:hypothetical protein
MNSNRNYRPYPTGALHNAIRDALWEVQRNLQAPDALIGGSFLTAMSIASQGDVDVELPTGQIRPALLNVATIADSGERKTGTDSVVLAPVYDHDAKQKVEFDKILATYQADLRYWDTVDASLQRKIIKALNNGEDVEHLRSELATHIANEPCKPERHRIIHQSITERPLMEALQGDGKCIAILSDEGEIVLKGGALSKLAPINKVWDGPKVLTFERADGSIEVNNPRVTLSFMVQERIFSDFMNKRGDIARGSGFLARFLISWPASTQGFRYMSLKEPVWDHLPLFHQRVTELLDATEARRKAGDTSRKVLSFSPEAKELWVKVQNDIEPQLQQGGPLASVRDFASKSLEITGRAAAIFHHFTGQDGVVISMETLQRALDVVGWYFDEFVYLFGDRNDEPQEQKDVRTLGMYLHSRYWANGYNTAMRNEVRKCGPIRHQGRFEAALQRLCWEGSVIVRYENMLKRKGRLWIDLNPAAFS